MPAPNNTPSNLLIVDDDDTIQRLLSIAAQDLGWRPLSVTTGTEALEALNPEIEAVVLDHGLPDMNGLDVLPLIREKVGDVPVVMLTGLNDAETAVRALRSGAVDYLTKPFELKRLFDILGNARSMRRDSVSGPAPTLNRKKADGGLQSANPKLRKLLVQLGKAAKLDSTILLTGESGTGKTHFAREIHLLSARADQEFITVSCPAISRELLESELFGHERGAFTGASASRAGRFEQASKGTLFLDEIGDLPGSLQPKLLTVLQDREYFRVGGSKLLHTDARVIAATNVNLRERVEKGEFREDLYYRLNIIELHIPALRERSEDIPVLTESILSKIAQRRGVEGWTVSQEAAAALSCFDWPGNVRQLQNVLERATAFAEQPLLRAEDIIHLLKGRDEQSSDIVSMKTGRPLTLQEVERNAFVETYLRTGRNKAKTARELGISERSVYNLLGRHGLK